MKARVDRSQRATMDKNLIEANVRLLDENRYLKEDNKILLAKYEKIKKEATECIEILKYMLGEKEKIDFEIPKHEFFKEESRWNFMLKCCSCYFTDSQNSNLKESYYGYTLHCDCDFKDYENEIELFLDWISQYGNYNNYYEFIGYELYEEFEVPTLIYMKNNNYKLITLDENILESEVN